MLNSEEVSMWKNFEDGMYCRVRNIWLVYLGTLR